MVYSMAYNSLQDPPRSMSIRDFPWHPKPGLPSALGVESRRVVSCRVVSCRDRRFVSRRVVSRRVVSRRVVSRVLRRVVLRRVASCRVASCRVVLRRVVLCRVGSGRVLFSVTHRSYFETDPNSAPIILTQTSAVDVM